MIHVAFDPQLEAINKAYIRFFCNDKDVKFTFLQKPQWCQKKSFIAFRMIYFLIKSFFQFARGKYDLVHINSATLGFAAYMASFFKCRYIYTIHGSPHPELENSEGGRVAIMFWISRQLMNFVARRAEKIYAISKFTQQELWDDYNINSQVIYNGVEIYITDAKKVANIKNKYKLENKICIISVGRLIEYKHPFDTIRLFANIKKKYNNSFLIMIGSGILKEKVQKLVDECKLSKDVIIIDRVEYSEMPNWYTVADYFTIGSEVEGFGLVALEAVAYGCIPILPKAGAFKELFNDKFLYDKKNINELDLPKISEEEKEYLKKLPQRYSWNNAINCYKREYLLLTGESK